LAILHVDADLVCLLLKDPEGLLQLLNLFVLVGVLVGAAVTTRQKELVKGPLQLLLVCKRGQVALSEQVIPKLADIASLCMASLYVPVVTKDRKQELVFLVIFDGQF
jgi:hypothetical protein